METKLLDKGHGNWCVHTVEDDTHVAKIKYHGDGDWRCTVVRDTSPEGLNQKVEWPLEVNTVEEAYAGAVKKATENGMLPRLQKRYEARQKEADERTEKLKNLTPRQLLRSLLIHSLKMHHGHAAEMGESALFVTTLIEIVVTTVVEGSDDDKMEEGMQLITEHMKYTFLEKRSQKLKDREDMDKMRNELARSLGFLFGTSPEDSDEGERDDSLRRH